MITILCTKPGGSVKGGGGGVIDQKEKHESRFIIINYLLSRSSFLPVYAHSPVIRSPKIEG